MLASAPVGVLSRYLLARFVVTFLAVLAALVLLVAVIELLADFGDVIASGFVSGVWLIVLRIPERQLPLLIPIASFGAAYLSIGSAARSYEIVAMKAGGVSPLRVLVPVVAAAVVICGLALLVNETLAVRAHDAARRLVGGTDSEVTFRRGTFWYHSGDTIYNVRDADPVARELKDVAIFELDDRGRLRRSIRATTITVGKDGRWVLANATLRSFDPAHPRAPVVFERRARAELDRPAESALLDVQVSGLSIEELREYRDGQEPGDTEAVRAEALLHRRMAEPLASLVFVVLAIPLALRVEGVGSLAVPALQGVVAIFAFYMLREYGGTLATQGVTPPAATPWVILAAFLAWGAVRIWRAPR
jgi:lipopolysaccharide export system permease protein